MPLTPTTLAHRPAPNRAGQRSSAERPPHGRPHPCRLARCAALLRTRLADAGSAGVGRMLRLLPAPARRAGASPPEGVQRRGAAPYLVHGMAPCCKAYAHEQGGVHAAPSQPCLDPGTTTTTTLRDCASCSCGPWVLPGIVFVQGGGGRGWSMSPSAWLAGHRLPVDVCVCVTVLSCCVALFRRVGRPAGRERGHAACGGAGI